LPKTSVFECGDNSESSDKLEIVVAKQDSSESDLGEAAWFPLQRMGFNSFDDSSDELQVGELFHEFLCKNFPFKGDIGKFAKFMERIYGDAVCGDLGWLYEKAAGNSLPRPEFKIDAMEGENILGDHEGETVYINQRLVLDAISGDPRDRFILLLAMLLEYGHFLGCALHVKANEPACDTEGTGRAFACQFMECSEADLFSTDFEFADFAAPDSEGKEQAFKVEVSGLSRKERRRIFHELGSAKIWEGEV
jgi:hypothetical protein